MKRLAWINFEAYCTVALPSAHMLKAELEPEPEPEPHEKPAQDAATAGATDPQTEEKCFIALNRTC